MKKHIFIQYFPLGFWLANVYRPLIGCQCYNLVSALQAILGLFFQLSRYKQQQKQAMPASPARQGLSSIPGNMRSQYLHKCWVSPPVSSSPPPPWYSISLICIHDEMMHHHTLPFNIYPGMKYNKLTAIISQIMKHFWVPEPLSLVTDFNVSLCYFQFRAPLPRSVIQAARPRQQSGHTLTLPGPQQVGSKYNIKCQVTVNRRIHTFTVSPVLDSS